MSKQLPNTTRENFRKFMEIVFRKTVHDFQGFFNIKINLCFNSIFFRNFIFVSSFIWISRRGSACRRKTQQNSHGMSPVSRGITDDFFVCFIFHEKRNMHWSFYSGKHWRFLSPLRLPHNCFGLIVSLKANTMRTTTKKDSLGKH